jgi:SecD/SecF fusion protein
MAILLFGGETLKDFAFPLFLGVLSGTYSSIILAPPILSQWKETEPKYKAYRERISRPQVKGAPLKEKAGAPVKPAAKRAGAKPAQGGKGTQKKAAGAPKGAPRPKPKPAVTPRPSTKSAGGGEPPANGEPAPKPKPKAAAPKASQPTSKSLAKSRTKGPGSGKKKKKKR